MWLHIPFYKGDTVMIRKLDDIFVLDTRKTTYCFKVLKTGHLEHLYYGDLISVNGSDDLDVLTEKHFFAPGNTNIYTKDTPEFTLEDIRLEMSSYGKGDIREPFIEILHEDGGSTCDFTFKDYEIKKSRDNLITMPCAYEENGDVMELVVTLEDRNYSTILELHYCVFENRDVITRYSKVINQSKDNIVIKRIMSTQLDFFGNNMVMTTFNGSWAREMNKHDMAVTSGKYVNASFTGTSSSRANPFVILSENTTNQDNGLCYGINLIYSGNHYEACEVNSYDKTRFVAGINPASFDFLLGENEFFESPEAVMTVSNDGFNGMSNIMHTFVRECIVRGEWKKKLRPVLLNSWEASYFDIDEEKLLKLAKAGKDVGIELFVMDDGWFGKRNSDNCSLGDWQVNKDKLPNGLKGICDKVNALGLDFGIWVEPEMVNVDSELYRNHPEWVMEIPGKPHSEGRNQRILDLANPNVVEYLIETMSDVFSSANISYVKWDMNRIFSDYYSKFLPEERQGEVSHRYVLGLYKMMNELTRRFPHILFEGCAAGGNRFDLGILSYFPQIWASDNTDALYRVNAQTGYSYGYPMSTVTAHVSSCPNHQTLRSTPLKTRFNVAAFGVCGYECNLCELSDDELKEIKEQIAIYKEWREVLQFGDFYRGKDDSIHEWTCVSSDKKKAVGMIMQELVIPNYQFHQYVPKGLDKTTKYRFTNRKVRYNDKAFEYLKDDSMPVAKRKELLMNDKEVNVGCEVEYFEACGSVLMAGVKLSQAFSATGANENIRYFQDFDSRIYFMEQKKEC